MYLSVHMPISPESDAIAVRKLCPFIEKKRGLYIILACLVFKNSVSLTVVSKETIRLHSQFKFHEVRQ